MAELRGRAKTTGRFKHRTELEDFVWDRWLHTPRNQTDIAKASGVSQTTIATILNKPRRQF